MAYPSLNSTMIHAELQPGSSHCHLCQKLAPFAPPQIFADLKQRRYHATLHKSPLLPTPFLHCFPGEFKRPFQAKQENLNDSYGTNNTGSTEPSASSTASIAEKLIQPAVAEVIHISDSESSPKKSRLAVSDTGNLTQYSEQEVGITQNGSRRKQKAERTERPPKHKALLNGLDRILREGGTVEPCQYQGCGLPIRKGTDLASHVDGKHFRRPSLACRLCGMKGKHSLSAHFEKEHPGQRTQTDDLRLDHEEDLVSLTLECFPILRDAATILGWSEEPIKLTHFFAALAKSEDSVVCHFHDCQKTIERYSWDLQRHMLGHYPRPVFDCCQCRFKGNDIVTHCIDTHGHIGLGRKDGQNTYEDRRTEHEKELLQLALICFPNSQVEYGEIAKSVETLRQPLMVNSASKSEKNAATVWCQDTPEMRLLRTYASVLVEMFRAGLFKVFVCQYKTCKREFSKWDKKHALILSLDHAVSHARTVLEECAICGYKAPASINSHFRKEHPEERLIQRIDYRPKSAGKFLDFYKECYLQVVDAGFVLRSLCLDAELPRVTLAHLETLVGRKVECGECGENVDSRGTWPLLLHLLKEYKPHVFSCTKCRYQDNRYEWT